MYWVPTRNAPARTPGATPTAVSAGTCISSPTTATTSPLSSRRPPGTSTPPRSISILDRVRTCERAVPIPGPPASHICPTFIPAEEGVAVSANRFRDAALSAAARGWFVFPLRPGSKIPAITRWQQQATIDEVRIKQFWPPKSRRNVGVATGPSRLHVIDLDTHHGESGPETMLRLAKSMGEQRSLITYAVSTPTGGRHLYYRIPDGGLWLPNTAARLGPGIDSRGHGGYVVAAGSRTSQGEYRLLANRPTADLPPWLLRLLTPPPSPVSADPAAPPRHPDAYLRAIIDAETRKVTAAAPGTRNTTLFRAAFTLGRLVAGGELDKKLAHDALTAAGAVHIGHDDFSARELARTVDNGLELGAHRPRRFAHQR
ncbi:DNA primase [Nocardia seriolae]|nr:DNA primase [Nocardia seriolae]